MKIALVSLSHEGAELASRVTNGIEDTCLYIHDSVDGFAEAIRFSSIIDLTCEIFASFDGIVYFAPCGVAVRAIAPNMRDKYTDPAIVVVDAGGRYAISLLSGHEGGANQLAMTVGNIIGAEPVISTTTEAVKSVIVGVGCRRGIGAPEIVDAIQKACAEAGVEMSEVRLIASADIKSDEEGLLNAAKDLGLPVRFIRSDDIRASMRSFERSEFVQEKVNLPAVAEPAALLAGRRTKLILPKTAYNGITVAIARESFLWSE
ncbi:MAG: cobalt-precorrin 5A hydrolase [Armatimonadota bacterium]